MAWTWQPSYKYVIEYYNISSDTRLPIAEGPCLPVLQGRAEFHTFSLVGALPTSGTKVS